MPIDPNSDLARRLDIVLPIRIEPAQLSPLAGKAIVSCMNGQRISRDIAATRTLNDLAKYSDPNVMPLNLGTLSEQHPEIPRAVDSLKVARGWTRGQAVGRLVVDGARQNLSKPESSSPSMLHDIIVSIGGKRNPDGTYSFPF